MAKILSKFGEQQLVMVNYACGFNQSEMGKYFEWIIMLNICVEKRKMLLLSIRLASLQGISHKETLSL